MRVNKLVNQIVKDQAEQQEAEKEVVDEIDMASLCKQHKKSIKFAQTNMESVREEISQKIEKLDSVKDKEVLAKLTDQLRKLIAFESMFLNLNLLVLFPQKESEKKSLLNTLEDIEELKECFSNLGLTTVSTSNKKQKKDNDDKAVQSEAKTVLMDLLTSMLAQPQSFLRESANNCFKHFCTTCLDNDSLSRLLGIVSTPNQEADAFMNGEDAEKETEDGDEDEEEGEEISEGSDDGESSD